MHLSRLPILLGIRHADVLSSASASGTRDAVPALTRSLTVHDGNLVMSIASLNMLRNTLRSHNRL